MDNLLNLVEQIKKVSHFNNLSLFDLQKIVTAGSLLKIPGGSTIFSEGDPCSGMFVLIQGRIRLYKFGPMGQTNLISVIDPVIMINEVAVLDEGSNPVTAIAVEDCLLWQVGLIQFHALLERFPQVGTGLLKTMAKRNRELMAQCEDLSFRSVVARTAKLLLSMSSIGVFPINRRLCSVEEMAHRISTVPEAISRSLNVIKNRDLITVSRTEILVINPDGLANLAMLSCEKLE